jgi:hypothetical protein
VRYDPTGKSCNGDAPDIQPATLPATTKNTVIYFTVYDKTPFDEIVFYSFIDGVKFQETGSPGSRFHLTIEEGIHFYEVYAQDLALNRSSRVSATISCLVKDPMIRLVKPEKEYLIVYIPPPAPNGSFRPEYTIEFTVENLPDDNPKLLREVRVSNKSNGDIKSQKVFYTSNDFEFDIRLVRGKNPLLIEVRDINEQLITKECTVEVR